MSNVITEQQVIFYFALNETPVLDYDDDQTSVLLKQLDAIQEDAWEALRDTLPTLPEWTIRDEVDGFEVSPYELCANDPESPEIDGMTGFWVSIARDAEIDEAAIPAFKHAAVEAYQSAAKARQGTARLLATELYTVRQVTDFQRI